MAPRRTRRVVTTTLDDGASSGESHGISSGELSGREETNDDIDGAIAELGGEGAKAQLMRLEEATGRFVRVCTLDASQVSQEFIQQNFGGGRYKGRFRRADGPWGKSFMIDIDKRIPAKLPAWVTGEPAKSTDNGTSVVREDDSSMKSLLQSQIVEMIKDSNEMRAANAASQQALLASIMKMIETSANSTATLLSTITKAAPPVPVAAVGPTLKEIIDMQASAREETLKMLAAANKPTPDASSPSIEKTLNLMTRLREASGGFLGDDERPGGGPGGGDGFSSLLAKLAEVLLPVLAGAMQPKTAEPEPPARPEPPRVAIPAPISTAPAPGSPVEALSPVEEPPVPLWLTFAKGSLLEAAEEGRDPVDVAVSLMTLAPRRAHGSIREAVMREDAVDALIGVMPELAGYRTWVAECVAALRDEFNPPEPDGPAVGAPENN